MNIKETASLATVGLVILVGMYLLLRGIFDWTGW